MPDPPPYVVDHLPMFVLDVMRWADDHESILNIINSGDALGWIEYWGRAFTRSEIDSALNTLKRRGWIEKCWEAYDYWCLSEAGWRAWQEWIPPGEAGAREIISRALNDWDPLGVFDSDTDWPDTEYDRHIDLVLDALQRGAGIAAITDLLGTVRVDFLGLSPDPEKDARIAKMLHTALTAHWQREEAGR